MRLGNYRDRVTLQRPTFTKNAIGERITAWEDVATVFASVLPIRQTESVKAGGTVTSTTWCIRMHWRADITSGWRMLFRGQALDLVSVYDPIGVRIELEAIANETGGQ